MLRHALTRRALRPSVSHGRALLSATATSPPASHPSFDLVRSERLAEREADVFFYRHRETGASVMSVAVDDDNKVGSALMLLHSVRRHRRLLPRCHCCASTRITRTTDGQRPTATHACIPSHSPSQQQRAASRRRMWLGLVPPPRTTCRSRYLASRLSLSGPPLPLLPLLPLLALPPSPPSPPSLPSPCSPPSANARCSG